MDASNTPVASDANPADQGSADGPAGIASQASRSRRSNWALAAALVVLTAGVAPFIALSFYAHPQNDDFLFATTTFEYGFVHANAVWFLSWTGRFTSTAIMSMSPVAFRSVAAYQWAPAVIVALLLASTWVAVGAASPGSSRVARLVVTSTALAIFLAGMPNLVQGLYFVTGAVTYQLGGALLLLVWAFTQRTRDRATRPFGPMLSVAAGLVVFLAAGTNEIVALLSMAVLAYGILVVRAETGRVDRALVVLLLIAVGAGLLALLSPGNRARAAAQERDLLGALVGAAEAGASYAWGWLSRGPLLPAAALLLPSFLAAAARARRPPWHPALSVGAFVATYFACFVPPLYAGGVAVDGEVLIGALETRTVNVIFGFFLVGFLANLFGVVAWYARGRTFTWSRPGWFALTTAAAFLALMPAASNVRAAWADLLSGSAADYDRAQLARYEVIASCRGAICPVPSIPLPKTLSLGENALDLSSDGPSIQRYKQTSYAAYFRKDHIVLARPTQ